MMLRCSRIFDRAANRLHFHYINPGIGYRQPDQMTAAGTFQPVSGPPICGCYQG
jgi:hypothetical protein